MNIANMNDATKNRSFIFMPFQIIQSANFIAANVRALVMCRQSVIRPARTSAESSAKDENLQLAGICSVA